MLFVHAIRLPGSLIIREIEKFVLNDGAANGTAELIELGMRKRHVRGRWSAALRGLCCCIGIPEVEHAAVNIVRPGFRGGHHRIPQLLYRTRRQNSEA